MDQSERLDALAAGSVAIAGVMGILNVLAVRGAIDAREVKAVGDFMLDATARSQASPELQAHLHEAICEHLLVLLDAMRPGET